MGNEGLFLLEWGIRGVQEQWRSTLILLSSPQREKMFCLPAVWPSTLTGSDAYPQTPLPKLLCESSQSWVISDVRFFFYKPVKQSTECYIRKYFNRKHQRILDWTLWNATRETDLASQLFSFLYCVRLQIKKNLIKIKITYQETKVFSWCWLVQQQHPCCLNSHIFLSSQQTIKSFSTLGWSCVRFEGSLGRSDLVPLKEDKLHRSGPSTWWMLHSLFPLTHVSCMIQTVTLPFTTHSVTLLAALICSCSWYFVHPCWLQVACVCGIMARHCG